MNPLSSVWKAVTLPFTAIFVIALTGFINWFTSPGHWWFQWVAFGMILAVAVAWFRAAKAIAAVGLAAAVAYVVFKMTRKPSDDPTVVATEPQV